MHDRTGAAFLAALQNLNELSELLAVGRDDEGRVKNFSHFSSQTLL